MSIVFAAISTKGGVGKTTLLANFGGLLADIGYRVLLVDADTQPSLTSYYPLEYEAPRGLVEVVTDGTVDETTISRTRFPNLHLIRSNDGAAELQHWLHSRPDRRTRLRAAFATPAVADAPIRPVAISSPLCFFGSNRASLCASVSLRSQAARGRAHAPCVGRSVTAAPAGAGGRSAAGHGADCGGRRKLPASAHPRRRPSPDPRGQPALHRPERSR